MRLWTQLLVVMAIAPMGAFALDYTVEKVSADKAVLKTGQPIDSELVNVGDTIKASFPNGSTCALPITLVKDNKATVKITDCAAKASLTPGFLIKEATSPPVQEIATNNQETTSEGLWHFALGLGFTTAGKATFEAVTLTSTGGNGTGTAEAEFEKTISLILEARYLPENSWGFIGGLNYELERDLTEATATLNGTNVDLVSAPYDSIQVTTVYGSAVYRWKDIYLPFGLNISTIKYKNAGSDGVQASASGTVGGQIGVGGMLSDQFALELHSWVTGTKVKVTDSTGTLDLGVGFLSNLLLAGKYIF